MKTEAVVFDVDGTILDTREFIMQAFEHALRKHGHEVPERARIISVATGRMLTECYPMLAPNGDIIALQDAHREFQTDNFHLITAYDGLHDVLDALRERGILLGVYSIRGKMVGSTLEHVQALRYFDAVIDSTQVEKHKPHPEGVLKILEILGKDPSRAVMVGDTASDIGAGKAECCALTIGITHGLGTREALEEVGADHIVTSLREILGIIP